MPVLFGPRFQKFKEAKDLIAEGGAFSFDSASAFEAKMDRLLAAPEALRDAGKAAGHFVQSHGGATAIIMKQIGL